MKSFVNYRDRDTEQNWRLVCNQDGYYRSNASQQEYNHGQSGPPEEHYDNEAHGNIAAVNAPGENVMVQIADVHPLYKHGPHDYGGYIMHPLEWEQSIQNDLHILHELPMNADNAHMKLTALQSDEVSHSSWTNIKEDEDNLSE